MIDIVHNQKFDVSLCGYLSMYQRFNNKICQTTRNILDEVWDNKNYRINNFIVGTGGEKNEREDFMGEISREIVGAKFINEKIGYLKLKFVQPIE